MIEAKAVQGRQCQFEPLKQQTHGRPLDAGRHRKAQNDRFGDSSLRSVIEPGPLYLGTGR